MINIFNFFKKSKKADETLICELNKIILDKNYLLNLNNILSKNKFNNIQITTGEYININNEMSNECCIDVYFEKEFLYMLTIFEDGIVLLKNNNRISKDNDEELDYQEIYRKYLEESILQDLRQNAA